MPWIVDGDNVLGSRRDDRRKRELAAAVAALGRARGQSILLVFDGTDPGVVFPGSVIWSGAGKRADDLIRARVLAAGEPRGWTVVTDDRPLGDRCRTAGARVMRCAPFRRSLESLGDGREKPDRSDDVDYWESVFSEDDGPSA